ncbi:MFS transporter [Bradyrhizobium quebecense]|uniref:Putative tartrate transporter n=1 Tax=Bradyrhizobium quebecense TaxID=2748629 RepID=A0A973WLY9_9BRAD|nr:MFS transporter [Bradyrhizobium quebecense]UGA47334.1 MFS transporter [Bradyrhizobium quebecense]
MGTMSDDVEKRAIGKMMRRLIPFLILCYFVAYLDRVNVGFAKLHMNTALGLSEAAYGLGAGLFFVGYFFFEVPSNILLERFGARRWIARIMISWGIVSAAFAFIPQMSTASGLSSEWIFYFLRLLLGACEAGFFPGIIFYLTLWFPTIYRARVISLFMLAIPISSIIGAPISGLLLNLSGGGLTGWQWLFICEALPSVLVGFAVLALLPDFPRQATWLQPDEVKWVQNTLEIERQKKEAVEHISVLQSLTDSRVLACAFVYFCLNAASYGVAFFLPTIIKAFGVTDTQTGLIAALPFVFGAVGMVLLGRHSDKTGERRYHVAGALVLAAVGIGLAGLVSSPVLIIGLLCLAQIGVSAVPPMFWPMPASILNGASAAAGIAAINSLGNLSGFAGPFAMGYLKDLTGGFTAGLLLLAVVGLIGALVTIRLRIDPVLERSMREPMMAH